MTIKEYPINNFMDPDLLRTHLDIDQHDLTASMMKQAGYFAYYSTLAAKAQQQCDQMEHLLDIAEARLDRKIRDAAASTGTKITEPQVKASIALEPAMISAKKAVHKASMVATLCKSAADSFRHRRDMLIQISYNSREDRKGELRTFESQGIHGQQTMTAHSQAQKEAFSKRT